MTDEMNDADREKRHKLMAHMDRRGEIVPGTSLAMGGDFIPRAKADAMVAAAYEVAAGVCDALAVGYSNHKGAPMALADAAHDIRALATTDQRAALDRLIADKVAEATTPKPLVWDQDPESCGEDWFFRAHAFPFVYEVGCDNGEWWWQEDAVSARVAIGPYSSADAAKSAAQADYTASIRAALKGGA